jgi:O-antigen/teichoic acid export membrane protein
VGALVARYLGPEQFGVISYVLAYLAFFQVLANLGVDSFVVRNIVRYEEEGFNKIGDLLGSTFLMRLTAGILCWFFAIVIMIILNGWNSQMVLLVLFAGGSLVFQAADTIDLWFQSQNQSRRTVLAKFFAYLISGCIKIYLVLISAPLIYFAVAIFLEFGFSALALIFAYQRYPSGQLWVKKIKKIGVGLLRESWPIILSGLAINIYMRIDQVIIKEILGEREVGLFTVASSFSLMWCTIPSLIITSFMPMITKSRSTGNAQYLAYLSRIFRILLGISIAISILVNIWSNEIISFVYGDQYLDVSPILNIVIISIIPIFLGIGQGLWVNNEKKSNIYLVQTFVGVITSIFLNIILIRKYGLIGAAISIVITQFLSALVVNFFIERKLFLMQLGFRVD